MIENPVVLITGASRGLGRAIAVSFAKKNYAVGINFNTHENEAVKTAALVDEAGGKSLLLKADVRSSKEVEAMVRMVSVEWGRIDVLVNNAGNSHDNLITKMSDEDWTDTLAVNLNGPFYCTRSVLPVMQKAKTGSIVNITSYLAKKAVRGAANYAAAKAAVISLTQSTALEVGSFNIRVNAVMPGFHERIRKNGFGFAYRATDVLAYDFIGVEARILNGFFRRQESKIPHPRARAVHHKIHNGGRQSQGS